jgi:methyltransferase (TIGR00027 family)
MVPPTAGRFMGFPCGPGGTEPGGTARQSDAYRIVSERKKKDQAMTTRTSEQKPSETALFAALRRTLAYKEYHNQKIGPDYLAEKFLPPYYRFFLRFRKVQANTKNKLNGFMPGLNEYLIARTAFFDGLFRSALEEEIPQIVLLGAGYDSRGYRFSESNRGTKIFELDAAPTQQRKLRCLKAAHVREPREVRFVPIDFTVESLSGVLEKAGFSKSEKALFLWEGVSYYLDRRSVKETLGYIGRSAHRESLIAFDCILSVSGENLREPYGAAEFMRSMREHHADEEMVFSLPREGVEGFLAENNLRLTEFLEPEKIERKYLLGDDGLPIGRMTGIFSFVCASPMD